MLIFTSPLESVELQADIEAQGQDAWGARILLLPTVIMNQNQYRGRLDTPSIVRGLCSGFKESSEPEVSIAVLLATACKDRDAEHLMTRAQETLIIF